MQDFICRGGRYYMVDQDDGNKVVYLRDVLTSQIIKPVWDQWSHEATHPEDAINVDIPNNPPNNPIPVIDNFPIPADRLTSVPVLIAEGVNPIGMSYWRNINNWSSRDFLDVFLSVNDVLWVYSIDFRTLKVISKRSLGIHHTGEGCSFSAIDGDELYVPSPRKIEKRNIRTGGIYTLWYADNYNLWQPHVNYDETTISASIQDESWHITKWGIIKGGKTRFFGLQGEPDECQIDKSGEWLFCKEKWGDEEFNRIINLRSGQERIVRDTDGQIGHSDCGFGCAFGEFDKANEGGALNKIEFDSGQQQILYASGIWNMGYVSYTNAKPDVPLFSSNCLMSTPYDLISIKCDGSRAARTVCKHDTRSTKYEHRVKANLCPHGKYAAFTAFVNGSLNAYIVGIPDW